MVVKNCQMVAFVWSEELASMVMNETEQLTSLEAMKLILPFFHNDI